MDKNTNSPILYWITGLSGAGKTTIAKELYYTLKKRVKNIVLLDGDQLRVVFGNNKGYSIEQRLALSRQYCNLCKMLIDQDIHVICATISMFNQIRDWNSNNIDGYLEIYVRVPMDILIKRDQKQLYSRALKKEISGVMGIDIPYEEPCNPDMIINNDGATSPDLLAKQIIKFSGLYECKQNSLNSGDTILID
ncbi:adenylylsulfate kinase [Candidatus Magnetomorum sp. HK-1]|nr:adenylylsulfate kinase [Candidatus Magnetomorum sp. HK-1]